MLFLAACQSVSPPTLPVLPDTTLSTPFGTEVQLYDFADHRPVAMMVVAGPTDAEAEYLSMLTSEADGLGLREFLDAVESGEVHLLWIFSDRTPHSSEDLAKQRLQDLPANATVLRDDGQLATTLDVAYPRPARAFWLEPELAGWGGDFWWRAASWDRTDP